MPLSYAVDVNPEPWTVPAFSVVRGRNGGRFVSKPVPDGNLVNYQRAIKEGLETQRPILIDFEVKLELFFWRQLAVYQGDKRKESRNQSDATNMQKATEDALQGVLLTNDRLVRQVTSTIVEQGPDVRGRVGIRLTPWQDIGSALISAEFNWPIPEEDDNSW